ncbi:type II secretion system F family protein [Agrococcus sp. SGAir0287]|uniref:type II secretion system F family protein n=1 Tax=Agrococcus sp. SGAir0287 TaxID=2070347 RepID=UPI0010CCDB2D|nr:type II secretion system F family protein [Agrococcus sp. SGAir0287]QCR18920.1 type II secretion system protein F [Agrococcus sp. SGAir0287]
MTWLLGAVLGLGLVLCASPWLWPRQARAEDDASRPSRVRDRLTQAGLHEVPLAAVVVVAGLAGVIAAGVALAITPVVPVALAAGLAGLALPFAAVAWRARRRRRARSLVWPDVVDHLVSGVRSGLALPDAVAALATAGPAQTREAFRAFEADHRATGSFAYALDRLKDRLADPVADRILETLRMARDVGGSEVAHVLRDLAAYLRSDLAVRSELEARQSWVVSAARLGVVAPWLVLLLLSTRPEAAAAYNTPGGVAIVAGGLVVTVVAYRVMVRLGRLPEEGRWFA